MRRLLSFICCLTLCVLCVCPTVTAAVYVPQEYTYGDFTYEVHYNYTQLTAYSGAAEELILPAEIDGYPVQDVYLEYTGKGEPPRRVVIPEGVLAVGKLFDEKAYALEEVVLPQGLKLLSGGTHYGETLFGAAENLKAITVPSSVVLIVGNVGKVFPEGITLRGEADSYIARWAKANGYTFETITPPRSVGDVNGDNLVNSTDARLILQYFVNGIDEEGLDADFADVDGSGEVDSTDARLALQYFVGAEQPEAITAPAVKPFDGLIDPGQVKRVYAIEYKRVSPIGSPMMELVREGEVDDPVAFITEINNYLSKNYSMEHSTSKSYATWSLIVSFKNGEALTFSSEGFYYCSYRIRTFGVFSHPFWND